MPFLCELDYKPNRRYTRQELIDLILSQRALLCAFAQASGYPQVVLGLDFDRYNASSRCVPVLVMDRSQAQVLAQVESRKFAQALAAARVGESVLVTFSSARLTGWFRMDWAAGELHQA
jgi:hypothetical protein